MSEVRLAAESRTEFGKGAARRTRRAGKIPAVLYGHGSDPKHLALPALEFARVVREHGQNAVLTLDVDSKSELALTKTVTTHPIKNYIEHVDLLLVQRGEKVSVEVPVVLTGDPVPGTLVTQDLTTIAIEVEALHIPEQVEVSL
ncbi:50S ribosomal protein L25/general stress protein Ctc, partial [Kibdelosporangium lantanae]